MSTSSSIDCKDKISMTIKPIAFCILGKLHRIHKYWDGFGLYFWYCSTPSNTDAKGASTSKINRSNILIVTNKVIDKELDKHE